ncbi:hypothetical protein CP959_10380, partial [Aliarcobacter skirrowii CCUG 10374]
LTLRNRNGILSPTRLPIPPHSHLKVVFEKPFLNVCFSNWTGIIIDFFLFVKTFCEKNQNFIKFINFNEKSTAKNV